MKRDNQIYYGMMQPKHEKMFFNNVKGLRFQINNQKSSKFRRYVMKTIFSEMVH